MPHDRSSVTGYGGVGNLIRNPPRHSMMHTSLQCLGVRNRRGGDAAVNASVGYPRGALWTAAAVMSATLLERHKEACEVTNDVGQETRRRDAPGITGWRWDIVIVVGLTLAAAALRFRGLGAQGLWYDEAWTRDLAAKPFRSMLRMIPRTETTPPLYYVLNWFTWRAFGPSDLTLRLVSAVAGTLTVPAVWQAGRSLISSRAGVIAAALCTFSPLMWWYSQEARAYALAALLCAVAMAFLGESLKSGRRAMLFGWAVFSALAVSTQYVAVLPTAIAGLLLLRRLDGMRRRVLSACALPLLTGIALIPLAVKQRGTGNTDWVPLLSFNVRLVQVPAQLWVGNAIARSHGELIVGAIAGSIAVVALALLARRSEGDERRGMAVAATLAFGTFALMLVAVILGWDLLIARNLLVAWPAACVAAGGALSLLKPRAAATIVSVVCLALLALVVRVQTTPALQRVDWRGVPALLGPVPPGGRVVALQPFGNKRPLSAYARNIDFIPDQGATVTELEIVSAQLPQPRICWWGGVCADGIRVDYDSQPLDIARIHGFGRVAVRRWGHFTVVQYRSAVPRRLTSDSVREVLPPNLRGGVLFQRP